ncbi:hypothetical protein GCM10027057_07100 [Marisediminicola antarctica]
MGRVEILLADAGTFGGTADPMLPRGAVTAASAVTAPPGVLGILSHFIVADDLGVARAVWSGFDGASKDQYTVITKSGDVLSQYVMRGGSGSKRSRIELVAERDAAAARLDEVTSLIERARFALAEQRGTVTVAKQQSAAALSALREFDSRLAARTQKINRARVQVEAAQAEAERLDKGLAPSITAVADAEAALAAAKHSHDEASSRPRPILDVAARDALFDELELARESEVEARLQVETARERVRAEELRAEALQRQLEAERTQAEEAARRAVIRRRQVASAEAVLAALPAVLDAVDRSVSQARVELAAREAERSEQNEELSALRRDESGLRERLHAISEDVHGLEMQLYESKLHLSTLLERSGNELGLVEEVLVDEYGPQHTVPVDVAHDRETPEAVPFVRGEQEQRLVRAERKLAQLGRVNPLALEEFEALEQRHRFLTEQLTDLTNTRKDLLTIIDEIDDKMQHIFASAFDDTRDAFNEVFPILFPGGTGSIHLTDPDNLLTTGIEVSVKPAGKKIERLSLLSGGERSLAAVALLIAIFKARPSPFYIMDEVEAALDDANLGRLLTIFEDLRETSQLIIITHQKRTMEIADALYGVSMRADGISAVVGQRVQREPDDEERAAS